MGNLPRLIFNNLEKWACHEAKNQFFFNISKSKYFKAYKFYNASLVVYECGHCEHFAPSGTKL